MRLLYADDFSFFKFDRAMMFHDGAKSQYLLLAQREREDSEEQDDAPESKVHIRWVMEEVKCGSIAI